MAHYNRQLPPPGAPLQVLHIYGSESFGGTTSSKADRKKKKAQRQAKKRNRR
jgi:hypothetical protein